MSQRLHPANGLGLSSAVAAAAVSGQQCLAILRTRQLNGSKDTTAKQLLCPPAQGFKSLDRDREQGRKFRREVSPSCWAADQMLAHGATCSQLQPACTCCIIAPRKDLSKGSWFCSNSNMHETMSWFSPCVPMTVRWQCLPPVAGALSTQPFLLFNAAKLGFECDGCACRSLMQQGGGNTAVCCAITGT